MQYVSTQLRHSLNIESVVSIHYFEYTADFRYPGEEHDFWELIYCDKGELRISAGDHDLLLRHGQAFLHPLQRLCIRQRSLEAVSQRACGKPGERKLGHSELLFGHTRAFRHRRQDHLHRRLHGKRPFLGPA